MSVASRPPHSRPVKRATSAADGTSAAAKKASAQKTPGQKTPVQKTPAKKSPAQRIPAKKAPAQKAPAKKAPAKKTAANRPLAKRPPAQKLTASRSLATAPVSRPIRSSVSLTSAERFAKRVRARRRRRALIIAAVLLVLAGLLWVTLMSPWATVQKVEVIGTDRVSLAAVRAEVEMELGHPMLLVRTGDIVARVSQERLIHSVRVRREWPGTILVQVEERVPVAALPAGKGLSLVDRDGVEVERVAKAPAGLPRLEVARGADAVPALRGCLDVLRSLPPAVSQRLLAIGADSPDGIWLKLRDSKVSSGARVEWGDSAQTPRKARVLTALLSQHAVGYDVRSPDTPAVRRK